MNTIATMGDLTSTILRQHPKGKAEMGLGPHKVKEETWAAL